MPRLQKHRFHNGRSGSAIAVHVILNAKENRVQKITPDGTMWVTMTRQNHDELLNDDLLAFLARVFGVEASDLEVVGGESGVNKWITVIGRTPDEIHTILEKLVN